MNVKFLQIAILTFLIPSMTVGRKNLHYFFPIRQWSANRISILSVSPFTLLFYFYHYLYSVYNLHFLQISPNSLHQIIGFLCFSLIRDFRLTIDDFLFYFNRVRSSRASKYPHYHLTPKKNWVWFTGLLNKDPEIKTFYLLTGKWFFATFKRDIFSFWRSYNIGKIFLIRWNFDLFSLG